MFWMAGIRKMLAEEHVEIRKLQPGHIFQKIQSWQMVP